MYASLPKEISDDILLGSASSQRDEATLKILGVTHILVVGRELEIHHPNHFTYKKIDIDDDEEADISAHFKETYEFIEEAVENKGKVLIHCQGGISRSSTITIAYLMKKNGWKLEKAFEYVKERRKCIQPNEGFMKHLEKYEESLSI